MALGLVRMCRVCGCTDKQACPGGCGWVAEDLCSTCAVEEPGFESADVLAHLVAEVTAIRNLLVSKGVFTAGEIFAEVETQLLRMGAAVKEEPMIIVPPAQMVDQLDREGRL